jgi:hypothetical protein
MRTPLTPGGESVMIIIKEHTGAAIVAGVEPRTFDPPII